MWKNDTLNAKKAHLKKSLTKNYIKRLNFGEILQNMQNFLEKGKNSKLKKPQQNSTLKPHKNPQTRKNNKVSKHPNPRTPNNQTRPTVTRTTIDTKSAYFTSAI
jgi:hypothetical protein